MKGEAMNYITKIKVQNFFSIKDAIELDFIASDYSIDYHKERLFYRDGVYTNKLSVFYGANASGKTTLLKSIVWFAYFVANKNQQKFPKANANIYADAKKPSLIELAFLVSQREFIYKLELEYDRLSTIQRIKNETLKLKIDDKYHDLFDREQKIFRNLKLEQNDSLLFDFLSPNSSLLNESRSRMKDYHDLYNFFYQIAKNSNISSSVHTDLGVSDYDKLALALRLGMLDERNRAKIDEHSNEIVDENKIEESLKFSHFLFGVLSLLGMDIKKSQVTFDVGGEEGMEVGLGLAHDVDLEKYLDFELESNGTQTLIKLIYKIYETHKKQSVLVIDELDSLIHPMIVPILNLLTIKLNIQMFYSTHNIMNMKYLYNDEIYLIEKDNQHNTVIKTLKEYDGYENFAKLYQNSLLGGVPKIENINFDFIHDLEV